MRYILTMAIVISSIAGFTHAAPINSPVADAILNTSAPAKVFLGTWKGTYTATQGVTRLTLNVTRISGKRFYGTFNFHADISNPSVPSGSYTFIAKCDNSGKNFNLVGESWIVQPPGYAFASLRGQKKKKKMSGTVSWKSNGAAIGSFKLTKQ